VEHIVNKEAADSTKVINLIKSIQRAADEQTDDPFLITIADRARAVQESYEERQLTTQEALSDLLYDIEKDEQRKREQAEKGLDALTFFVCRILADAGVNDAEGVSGRIKVAFGSYPNWRSNESELRELRNEATFAVCGEVDDLDRVAEIVDSLFSLLTELR
jgi:type I restriction enzyme R subunit